MLGKDHCEATSPHQASPPQSKPGQQADEHGSQIREESTHIYSNKEPRKEIPE